MSEFRLVIKTDNAAFEDYPREVARILRLVADKVEDGEPTGSARDANGNTVAAFGPEGQL